MPGSQLLTWRCSTPRTKTSEVLDIYRQQSAAALPASGGHLSTHHAGDLWFVRHGVLRGCAPCLGGPYHIRGLLAVEEQKVHHVHKIAY